MQKAEEEAVAVDKGQAGVAESEPASEQTLVTAIERPASHDQVCKPLPSNHVKLVVLAYSDMCPWCTLTRLQSADRRCG